MDQGTIQDSAWSQQYSDPVELSNTGCERLKESHRRSQGDRQSFQACLIHILTTTVAKRQTRSALPISADSVGETIGELMKGFESNYYYNILNPSPTTKTTITF